MNINYLWWSVQFILGLLDFVMIYVVIHAFLKQRVQIKTSHLILGAIYTVTLAPVLYFGSGYLFRVLSILLMLAIIKTVAKYRSLGDLIVMLVLFIAIVLVVQAPLVAIIWVIREIVNFYESFAFLLTQSIATVLVILISKKFKLHQWFHAITRNTILKLIVITLTLIVFIINVVANFEHQLLYVILFAVFILLISLGLFPILVQLYQNTIDMISVHDLKNTLLSTGIAIQDETDIEAVKTHFRELSKAFGMDLSELDKQKLNDELEYKEIMTKRIETFICIKTQSTNKEVKVIADINYYRDYQGIEYKSILKWLGTMLDNALEATNEHPIYIHIGVTTRRLMLRMANEYIGHKGQDIQVIFEKGYTTKGENKGRGIGLHNLHREVTEEGGEILLDEYYTPAHNCHYLQISILFSNDD